MGKLWIAIILFNIILIKGIFLVISLVLQGLYTIAAKAIIFIPLWAVCEQEFMVYSIGNVIYMFGRAAYTWPKLHINQTQKTNTLHPQNRIKSRKGLRHIPLLIMYSFFTYDVQSSISIHSAYIVHKKGAKAFVGIIIMCFQLHGW